MARPVWRSNVASNCLSFILQVTGSVKSDIVIKIIVLWQLQPHSCGLLLLRFRLLNVVGWSLSINQGQQEINSYLGLGHTARKNSFDIVVCW